MASRSFSLYNRIRGNILRDRSQKPFIFRQITASVSFFSGIIALKPTVGFGRPISRFGIRSEKSRHTAWNICRRRIGSRNSVRKLSPWYLSLRNGASVWRRQWPCEWSIAGPRCPISLWWSPKIAGCQILFLGVVGYLPFRAVILVEWNHEILKYMVFPIFVLRLLGMACKIDTQYLVAEYLAHRGHQFAVDDLLLCIGGCRAHCRNSPPQCVDQLVDIHVLLFRQRQAGVFIDEKLQVGSNVFFVLVRM